MQNICKIYINVAVYVDNKTVYTTKCTAIYKADKCIKQVKYVYTERPKSKSMTRQNIYIYN